MLILMLLKKIVFNAIVIITDASLIWFDLMKKLLITN